MPKTKLLVYFSDSDDINFIKQILRYNSLAPVTVDKFDSYACHKPLLVSPTNLDTIIDICSDNSIIIARIIKIKGVNDWLPYIIG